MTAATGAALGLALCAGPWFAVAESSRCRPFAALADFSGVCAAGAATVAALGLAVQLAALPNGLQGSLPFVVLAPPVIGAAPWAAGELCTGPSPRQEHAFASALIASYLLAVLTGIAGLSLLVGSLLTASAATAAYLCTRGSLS